MDQELVQYLDERFGRIEQRLDGHDQRFLSLDQRFGEVKRHTGVLVEGLRRELQLVAEGLTMHVQVQHVQERAYFDRKFEDTHALIRSSYDHLQQQHNQIQQRVENLERKNQN